MRRNDASYVRHVSLYAPIQKAQFQEMGNSSVTLFLQLKMDVKNSNSGSFRSLLAVNAQQLVVSFQSRRSAIGMP
jgi:hypothetical protein